jgi:hypothetical protein
MTLKLFEVKMADMKPLIASSSSTIRINGFLFIALLPFKGQPKQEYRPAVFPVGGLQLSSVRFYDGGAD